MRYWLEILFVKCILQKHSKHPNNGIGYHWSHVHILEATYQEQSVFPDYQVTCMAGDDFTSFPKLGLTFHFDKPPKNLDRFVFWSKTTYQMKRHMLSKWFIITWTRVWGFNEPKEFLKHGWNLTRKTQNSFHSFPLRKCLFTSSHSGYWNVTINHTANDLEICNIQLYVYILVHSSKKTTGKKPYYQ